MRKIILLLLFVSFISLVTLAYSFSLTASPTELRDAKFDMKRSADIREIKFAIETYYAQRKILPTSLTELSQNTALYNIYDPQTNSMYEYTKINATSYTLCTIYTSDVSSKTQVASSPLSSPHKKGHVCEQGNVTSNIYPSDPQPKELPVISLTPTISLESKPMSP